MLPKTKSILRQTNKFNVRVYGLIINDRKEVLLSDEELDDFKFTKFPGGGLELGEGTIDALKREFIEECSLAIEVIEHFYTTDFFVKSIFNDEQLLAIYYLVKPKTSLALDLVNEAFDFKDKECKQCFRMKSIADLQEEDLTFPIDKYVLGLLKQKYL